MGCQSNRNYVSFNITLCTEFFTLPEVEVTILESMPVKGVEEQVLQYIQDKFNKYHFKVQFMWNEIKLRSNTYLSDYHFPLKCSLNSQVEYMGELLTLKMLINGNETKIKMLENCNIGQLYTTTESFIKCDFKIYYKENELEPIYTLSNYGITDESELKVICADQFTSKLRWNSKRTGLILKGICQNPNCQAFQQKVISNLGYGIFNISKLKHQLDCPVCIEKAKFLAFGFHNCKYLISEDVLNCDGVYNFKVVKRTQ